MRKKLILGIFFTMFLIVGVTAQNTDPTSSEKDEDHVCTTASCCEEEYSFRPKKGDWTVQVIFGNNGDDNNYELLEAHNRHYNSYSSVNPLYTLDETLSGDSMFNMIGVETRFYTGDNFALRIMGSGVINNTPYNVNIPPVYDPDTGNVIIPGYDAVQSREYSSFVVALGGEFLFTAKNDRIVPYLGFNLPVQYARVSLFDAPTINEYGEVFLNDTGAEHLEITTVGGQVIAGIDYYVAKDFFIGFEVKPISYNYAVGINAPAPELDTLDTEKSVTSFFNQLNFKVGFKL